MSDGGLDAARRALREDGFARLGPLVDAPTLAALRADLDALVGPDPAPSAYGVLRHNVWQQAPAFAALIRAGRLAAVVRALLGLDAVRFFQDNLVWKRPGATARVEWHQDFSYWPLEAPTGLTLWLALDDADEASGCLHYLPGTHRLGERAPQDFTAGTPLGARSTLPPLDAATREAGAVAVRASAGEVVAHDPLVWHMSPANRTSRERRAWSLSWIAPSSRWDPPHASHPFNFQLAPRAGALVAGELFPRFDA